MAYKPVMTYRLSNMQNRLSDKVTESAEQLIKMSKYQANNLLNSIATQNINLYSELQREYRRLKQNAL